MTEDEENLERRHRAHRRTPGNVPVVWIDAVGGMRWDCPECVEECDVDLRDGSSRRVYCRTCRSSWERARGEPWVHTANGSPIVRF